jgi:hypothetical protein
MAASATGSLEQDMNGYRFSGKYLSAVLAAILLLGGCSSVRETLGLEQTPPDEFQVTVRAPLSMPDDFGLRAPRPGAAPAQEEHLRDRTRQIVLDTSGKKKATPEKDLEIRGVTQAEAALLRKIGASEVDPNIRQVVERETTALEIEGKSFVEDLMFWKNKKEPPAKVVDPVAERRRIQGNVALGKDATVGLTPEIERKKSGGLLQGLF